MSAADRHGCPMHVDRQTFERSFLYLGPGYDIQPLLRFTHLCDTFLYPNLYLDRVNVSSSDDGRRFRDTTRLDAIEGFLREAGSPWTLQASGPLSRRGMATSEGKSLPSLFASRGPAVLGRPEA